MLDIAIRGATLVDGSGGPVYLGDVGVQDGVIASVGGRAGPAKRDIDAHGLIVTPGFIDVHTHLDAQIGWDPLLTPLSWHGVTTALLGNCGVTFAPCKPDDRARLAAMMETVEDIPREAILTGLPWDWETYGEYLASIERSAPAINVAGLVGHCAVRFLVMGERAVDELATLDEINAMSRLVADALDDGAIGFSTSRLPGHMLPDGRSIPGTYAAHEEVMAIGREVAARNGLMQNVVDFARKDMANGELLRKLARDCGARVLFSYTLGYGADGARKNAAHLDRVREGDLDITALTLPRGTGFVHGLQSHLPAYDIWGQTQPLGPEWSALKAMPFGERLKAVQNADVRALLVAEAKAADEAKLTWLRGSFWMGAGPTPNYLEPPHRHLAALASEVGEHWCETYLRLALESEGKGLFTWRWFSPFADQIALFLKHDHVLPGLSDAGAHVAMVMDCAVYTFVLSHWVRDAKLYELAEGVRRITSAPARVLGLADRGRLAPGYRADINVIDLANLREGYPELVHDFPGGAPRFIQPAHGYIATLVNGVVAFENGAHTGAHSGAVVRRAAGARR